MSESELETLMKNISNFTKKIYSVPEFREWKKQITLKTLMYMDGFEGENNNLKDFKFSEKIENEYKLVDLFIKLHSCYISFCDCEYYFRRYPFRGLPIERDTHLNYICEMYFNRISEFKEKMKNLFDEIHKFLAKKKQMLGV